MPDSVKEKVEKSVFPHRFGQCPDVMIQVRVLCALDSLTHGGASHPERAALARPGRVSSPREPDDQCRTQHRARCDGILHSIITSSPPRCRVTGFPGSGGNES